MGGNGAVGRWSDVMTVTTTAGPENVFAGMAESVPWPAGSPLRWVGKDDGTYRTVRGRQGMVVRAATNQLGYFEARVAASGAGLHVLIGLTMQDVPQGSYLGGAAQSVGWDCSDGQFRSSVPGCPGERGFPTCNDGDTVGLMVDCHAQPVLRFYVNGVEGRTKAFAGAEGVWYPAFSAVDGGFTATDRPAVPALAQP